MLNDPQVTAALTTLIVALLMALLGVLAWLGRVLPGWLERAGEIHFQRLEQGLAENTKITTQTRHISNGQLAAARDEAAKYRAIAERYGRIIRELNGIPDARPYLDQAAQAMRAVEYDKDWDDLQRRLLGND